MLGAHRRLPLHQHAQHARLRQRGATGRIDPDLAQTALDHIDATAAVIAQILFRRSRAGDTAWLAALTHHFFRISNIRARTPVSFTRVDQGI
jgi:hypothetical protein